MGIVHTGVSENACASDVLALELYGIVRIGRLGSYRGRSGVGVALSCFGNHLNKLSVICMHTLEGLVMQGFKCSLMNIANISRVPEVLLVDASGSPRGL